MDNHIEEVPTSSTKDKGFTLVELLIVIVILGILATVTVFAVRGITTRGQSSACQADRNTLETAAEAWFANNAASVIPNATAQNVTDMAALSPAVLITQSPEGKLVVDGLMRSQSPNYILTTNGGVTPETAAAAKTTTTPATTVNCAGQ